MENHRSIPEFEKITNAILMVRDEKVMLDSDLAKLYQVNTKQLNQAVKRNIERFPDDFMFQLNAEEKAAIINSKEHLQNLKYSSFLPYVFTEHGALMIASILNTDAAVYACVQVIRAFVQMKVERQDQVALLESHILRRVEELEQKSDHQFEKIMQAIEELKSKVNS